MKFCLTITVFLAFLSVIYAQNAPLKNIITSTPEAEKTADKKAWVKTADICLGLSQVANRYWISCGDNKLSVSAAATANAFATRKWERKTWDNMLTIQYGLSMITSSGIHKINDRIELLSKFSSTPARWKNISLSVLGQLRTQLTNGYDYDYFGSAATRRNSGFFAPAYIIVAPGFNYNPVSWISVFASPAATRWTVVSNGPYSYVAQGGIFNGHSETSLAALYGVNPAAENRGEFGFLINTIVRKVIMKNVGYFGKMEVYSNYLKNPANVDLFWTNQFKLKVNKLIQVNYSLDLQYDDNIKNPAAPPAHALGLQLLSTLGIGFALNW